MKTELGYFKIEDSIGGSQDWCRDYMMKMGGCAAVTACDSSICFDTLGYTEGCCPFDGASMTKDEYISFTTIMKPYLRPRWRGINRLELFTEGYGRYLEDRGIGNIGMEEFSGHESVDSARTVIRSQIEKGLPVPILVLHHKKPSMDFYVWHWFILAGYDDEKDAVKAVTYGSCRWLDLPTLWDTGHDERGGLIVYNLL